MTAQIAADARKIYFHTSRLSPWPLVNPYLATRTLAVRQVAVDGRRFAVERLFLEDTDIKHSVGNYPAATISAAVAWILRNYEAGDMLVSVADVAEISACVNALKNLSFGIVCPLHANSDTKEKHRALTSGIGRKVNVASNVAETSLTTPGVKFVINYGME